MPNAADEFLTRTNKRAMRLARYEASIMRRALPVLRGMERDMMTQLRATDLTEFGRQRLEAMLAQTRDIIRQSYGALEGQLITELDGLGQIEADWTANALIQSTGLNQNVIDSVTVVAASQTDFMGTPLKETLERQAFGVQARFADQVRIGMGLGETMPQIARRIGDTGVFQTSRRDLERLARTAVTTVSNNARMQTFEANDDVVEGYEHISALDNRVSEICAARADKRWDLDKKPIGHDLPFRQPALHFNCRSVVSVYFKPWTELGIPEEDLPARTRASMDGQVPESTTYETWLKGRSKSEQNEILGTTKADLWRDGKLSLRDMVNGQGNRALTLEELGIDD